MSIESCLVVHAGGRRLDRAGLGELIAPTKMSPTHTPIPHRALVERTIEKIEGLGVRVTGESHCLSHNDNRYFGVFGIAAPAVGGQSLVVGDDGANASDGYELIVGLRNSHDRSYQASLCLGSRVFVCDNLAFSGEITIARKHTKNILRDIPRLMSKAVGEIMSKRIAMEKRIEAYKGSEINDRIANDLIVKAVVDHGIISAPKMELVVNEWRKPTHEEFAPRTAWSLFNAFTEVLKSYNTDGQYKRSQPLHGVFDAAFCVAQPELALAV